MSERFPVGGEKEKVFAFLKSHGFVMLPFSDKHWLGKDGSTLVIYGSGSQARITNGGTVIADGPIESAVAAATGGK